MSSPSSELVARLAHHRILVVGDVCLDEYLIGRVQRLSREAPVPVLQQTRVSHLPGGAANPAANIASAGSQVALISVVGADESAALLVGALTAGGVETGGLVTDAARPTTRKTRIVAEGSYVFAHHLARVDRSDDAPLAPATERRLCELIETLMPACRAVLVSDYRSGVVTPAVIAAVQGAAREHGALTVVDSQGDLGQFTGFDLVRCNRHEAAHYLGHALITDADFERALVQLVPQLGAGGMIISRGSEGLSLLKRGEAAHHLASSNRSQVFDVTGAGDTLIAVVTLALAAGLHLHTAAHLGNVAAGIAVRRLGAVAITPAELIAALDQG